MPLKIASIFVEKIPAESFMSKVINESYIDKLHAKNPSLRLIFFLRRDVDLYELKRSCFFSPSE